MKLANKIALITGAGSGMGRVAAVLFAQEGARIGAIDVDKKGAQGTSKDDRSGRRQSNCS
jgi:NAD(P)-dependent dehydrogenase (short-subunit alcohol dehydrogenase family)